MPHFSNGRKLYEQGVMEQTKVPEIQILADNRQNKIDRPCKMLFLNLQEMVLHFYLVDIIY